MHMKLYSGSVINSKLCILSSGGCQNFNTVTALDPYVSEHSFGILLGNQNAISYICANVVKKVVLGNKHKYI